MLPGIRPGRRTSSRPSSKALSCLQGWGAYWRRLRRAHRGSPATICNAPEPPWLPWSSARTTSPEPRSSAGRAAVGRQPFRLQSDGTPFLSIFSEGRRGPGGSGGFSGAQVDQIRRTVRRAPEVMVKVTGGGKTVGAVVAHLAYISQRGELEIETDEGQRISKAEQKALVKDWHLELTAGQYRKPQSPDKPGRSIKLVHNIVLSMPAPTPPEKVLAAAKTFAREKFGLKHRYVMALHTHQQHPHVHLVVKAERENGRGRLHIDKAMLREWRQDFAQMMREQGIAANATPRSVRGQTTRATKDAFYRTRQRGQSYALREKLDGVVR